MRMRLLSGSWCKGVLQAGPLWSSEPSRSAPARRREICNYRALAAV